MKAEAYAASGRNLLVKIHAISVNPVDAKIRMLQAPADGSHAILGWEAGATNRSGTNAEFLLVDERIVGKAPQPCQTPLLLCR